jgi:hypothetical protein
MRVSLIVMTAGAALVACQGSAHVGLTDERAARVEGGQGAAGAEPPAAGLSPAPGASTSGVPASGPSAAAGTSSGAGASTASETSLALSPSVDLHRPGESGAHAAPGMPSSLGAVGAKPAASSPASPGIGSGIAEDAVKRYVAAQREILLLSKRYAEEALASADKVPEKTSKTRSAAARKNAIAARTEHAERFEASAKAIRDRSGVTPRDWELLDKLYESIFTGRTAWRQSGGDAAIAKLERDLQAELARMPAEQRARAAPELLKLADGLKGLRDGAEARSRYGDAAVDLALEHMGDIEALRDELFKTSLRRP